MKWKLYWLSLITVLLSILYWKNKRYYAQQTTMWNVSKSLIEGVLLFLSAVFMPAILAVYGGMWITRKIERPGIRVGVGFVTSIVMMLMLTNFLEFVVLIGVFSIELISTDFLAYMRERKQKRGVALVLDGRCA